MQRPLLLRDRVAHRAAGPRHGALVAGAARLCAGACAGGARRRRRAGRLLRARPDLAERYAGPAGMMRVAVVDYGSGNLASASRALALAAAGAEIAADVAITAEPEAVARADRVVLPGQGAFRDCARRVGGDAGDAGGDRGERRAGTPFLGICVGMQLMAERGLEQRDHAGLRLDRRRGGRDAGARAALAADGLERAGVRARRASAARRARTGRPHLLRAQLRAARRPGRTKCWRPRITAARCRRMVAAGNRAGTQFHVEKSQEVGLRMLANFLRWSP